MTAAACNSQPEPSENQQTSAVESPPAPRTPYENIDVSTFKSKMQDPNTVVLDVRTPAETDRGIIDGALIIDIRDPDFASKISDLDKEKTYLVYCQSGGRSARACEMMSEMGFADLYNLENGYSAWPKKE